MSWILWSLCCRSIRGWLPSWPLYSGRTTFVSPTSTKRGHEAPQSRADTFISRRATPIIDADFERVEGRNRTDDTLREAAANNQQSNEEQPLGSKSLLEMALESDPSWNVTRIPFMNGPNFIDVKLAFMAELDGVQYGIGIPSDHAAAVTIERKDGQVINLSPDNPENEEMIQIMAGQLQEHVGKNLTLKQTPRILTIQGPLEEHTKDWREKLVPEPAAPKALLDQTDEDLKFFHDFMKKELGEEEYKKTLQESPADIDPDLLDLFGDFSSQTSMEDLFSEIQDDGEDLFIKEMEDFVNKKLSHDGVALKLLSYSLQDGNKYSVVHPLKPVALVAKYTEDGEDIRFDLLDTKDAELLIPRLEESCREELEKAGLTGDSITK